MENLRTGQFYGETNEIIHLDGLTLTDTEYTHDKVDWHYHENAYFTFILDGTVLEGNKKEIYHCSAGSLLYHNWQESHYNIKPKGFTRGFHIELDHNWFKSYGINPDIVQGSANLLNPQLRVLMYNIFKEMKLAGTSRNLAVHTLLITLFEQMGGLQQVFSNKVPLWVYRLKDLLQDSPAEEWTLQALSGYLDIHPAHLSRGFPRYFNCNLGEYIRTIKIQRSLALLNDDKISLTDVAFACGFSDQSHFIRAFKSLNALSPSRFRKLLLK